MCKIPTPAYSLYINWNSPVSKLMSVEYIPYVEYINPKMPLDAHDEIS